MSNGSVRGNYLAPHLRTCSLARIHIWCNPANKRCHIRSRPQSEEFFIPMYLYKSQRFLRLGLSDAFSVCRIDKAWFAPRGPITRRSWYNPYRRRHVVTFSCLLNRVVVISKKRSEKKDPLWRPEREAEREAVILSLRIYVVPESICLLEYEKVTKLIIKYINNFS